ncbi:MAG: hypothetical protein JXA73_23755 [Acidobacteria bacterium]|nr:hypothetical protein [Acidobacteriota bacterium]
MIGKTLGHYQISSQIGKGGMGEVFQGKDNTLNKLIIVMPTTSTLPDNAR